MPGVSPRFQAFVVDLLTPLSPVARRMFSGVGLFHSGAMFGLLVRDTLYFRVDAATRERFERAGSEPFSYMRGERRVSLSATTPCRRICSISQTSCSRGRATRSLSLVLRPGGDHFAPQQACQTFGDGG
jgi:TfoX/Sxy family transcriptional regulator of competence genes